MADKEKVVSDPIEIEGIRIGDDRFKIKANLDLNRRNENIENAEEDFSIIGIGSIARSSKKNDLIEKAVARGEGSISLGEGSISLGKESLAIGKYAVAQGDNSISIYNRVGISDLEKKYLTGEKTFYVDTTSYSGELAIAPLVRIRDIPFTPYDKYDILSDEFKNCFGKTQRKLRKGLAYEKNSISLCGGMTGKEDSIAIGKNAVTGGFGSLAIGKGTSTAGEYSFSCGRFTAALSSCCFSEGEYTLSTSFNTNYGGHAEGFHTTSIDGSHSEGIKTEAYLYGHSEGVGTFAKNYSHAEGNSTQAIDYSHAEGIKTIVTDGSHAEGELTQADHFSHAEGVNTKANFVSHSEGVITQAYAYSHAEGNTNIAYGSNSHVGGNYNITGNKDREIWLTGTLGKYSIEVGRDCFSHGFDCLSLRNFTFTMGRYLQAITAQDQFIIGKCNKNYADSLFEIGNGDCPEGDLNILNNEHFGDKPYSGGFIFSPSNAFRVTKSGVAIAQNDFQLEDGTSFKSFLEGQGTLIPQPKNEESFLFSENGKWIEKDFKATLLNYLINTEEVSY